MFGLFKKKETGPKIINQVWASTKEKWNGCLQLLKEKPNTIFVAWFDETHQQLNQFLQLHNYSDKVIMYRQTTSMHANDYVFVEHYPLITKEKELFEKLNLEKVTVLNALDEPFLKHFGSDRIVELLSKLGLKEGEMIEHSMVSSSITNAQQKLEKHVLIEGSYRSQREWMEKNLLT